MGVAGLGRRWRRALLTAAALLLVGGLASPASATPKVCFMAYVNGFGSPQKDCPLGSGANTGTSVESEDPVFGIPFGVGAWVSP